MKIPRDALGLGLRLDHYEAIFADGPARPDYFEIISENFMSAAAPPLHNLERIAARFPLVMHGVGLNLLSHDALDTAYLHALRALADRVDPAFVSDHLCWTGLGGQNHHDLLPLPYRRDLIAYAAERAARVQDFLGRPFAIENLSSYVSFETSEMSEWDFYAALVAESGCHFMLDINNIYVSSQNHGFDPRRYLDAIDFSRVVQVHIAGHERQADQLIIDTHDRAPSEAVWDLYREAWNRGGPFPTLLEWDAEIPPYATVLAELGKARELRR